MEGDGLRRPRPLRLQPRPESAARGPGVPRASRPADDGDAESVIVADGDRSTVPATEMALIAGREAESAAENAPRASNWGRIPRFQRLQRLPHGLAAPPTALAASVAAPPTAVAASPTALAAPPTALAASLAAVAAGANSGCRVTYSGRPPDGGEHYAAGDDPRPR